jgi:hypothetical protein
MAATTHLPAWPVARTQSRHRASIDAAPSRPIVPNPALPASAVALLGTIAATALAMLAVILWHAAPGAAIAPALPF